MKILEFIAEFEFEKNPCNSLSFWNLETVPYADWLEVSRKEISCGKQIEFGKSPWSCR